MSRHPVAALTILVVLVALGTLLGAGTALAASHWADITDQQWIDTYHLTASQAATIAAGYPDGSFKPGLAVSRGQFAKMVVDGFDLGTQNPLAPTFTDVLRTNFYFPWVEGAHSAGVISGFEDGTFRPGTSISRQQADSILGIFLSGQELALTGHIHGDAGIYASVGAWYAAEGAELLGSFADAGSISSVHAPYAAYLALHQIVLGSSRAGGVFLDPGSSLTRAQAVALIFRVRGVGFETTGLHLHVTGIDNPVVAGTASTVRVAVVDEADAPVSGYTGTIHFTSNDPAAVLPANYTFTALDAGTHTFTNGVTLKTAGSRTVTATDTVLSTVTGLQAVTVNAGAAAKFAVTMTGGTTALSAVAKTAGTAFSVRVTAQDANGNTVPTYTGTVHLTSNAFAGTVNAVITTGGLVDAISVTPTVAGTNNRTIDASDGTITTTNASGNFTVNVAKFAVTMTGGTTALSAVAKTAGTAFSVRVTAQDANGNTVPTYTGTVHLTSNAFAGTVNAVITTGGLVDAISVTPTVAGTNNRTIDASDGTITTTNASGNFTVNVAKFAVTMTGGTTALSAVAKTAGTAFSVRVTAQDANGNTVPTYTGTVHLTSNAFAGTVNAVITTGGLVDAISVTPTVAGTNNRTIDASDGTITTTNASGNFTVNVGLPTAAQSTVTALPTSVPADDATMSTITVTLKDALSNPVAGKTVTLAHLSGPGTPTIGAASGVSSALGVVTFTVKSSTPGADVFQATDTTDSNLVITQTATVTFTALGASATLSTVTALPTSVPADDATMSTITVTLKDALSNPVAGKTVTLAHLSGPGTPTIGAASGVSSALGVVTFTVKSTTPGADVFQATDTTDSNLVITQTATVTFTAVGVSATLSTVTALPTDVDADEFSTSTITVTLKDALGNPVAGKTVTLAQLSGAGTPPISAASGPSDASGVVTFTVGGNDEAVDVFQATDTTDLTTITQTATVRFQLMNPSSSTIIASPTTVPADGISTCTVTVTLRDQFGVPVVGHDVVLDFTQWYNTAMGPASGPSDALGVVTFAVTSMVPGTTGTFSALDNTAGFYLTFPSATVTFN